MGSKKQTGYGPQPSIFEDVSVPDGAWGPGAKSKPAEWGLYPEDTSNTDQTFSGDPGKNIKAPYDKG